MKPLSFPKIDRRQGLLLVLVLLAALVLILSVASPSSAANNSPTRPRAAYDPQQVAAFNRVLQESAGITPRGLAVDNGCVNETSGISSNCSANDVRLGTVTGIVITDDGCQFPGDTVTFNANFQIINGSNASRRDIGVYFSKDSSSAQSGSGANGCFIGSLTAAGTGNVDADGDACRDLNGSATATETITGITVVCVDTSVPSDGKLDIPYCSTWRVPGDQVTCNGPLQATTDNPAKCNCPDTPITIDIDVPPIRMDIEKFGPSSAKPGETFEYSLKYTNLGDSLPSINPAINISITDQLPAQLKWIAFTATPSGVVCNYGAPYAGTNPYGGTITCTDPNSLPEENYPTPPGTALANDPSTWANGREIKFTVMVDPAAKQVQTITNTATVKGFSGLQPTFFDEDSDSVQTTTPVTVAAFSATTLANGNTRYAWTTATETDNAGFNLYARTPDGYHLLNDQLIPSQVVDSATPTEYSVEIAGVPDGELYIEDVALSGELRSHGPFTLGVPYGEWVETDPIDWAAIRVENNQQESARARQARAAAAESKQVPTKETALAATPVEFRVKQDGIYRVTYKQIMTATGVDLAGVSGNSLALTNRGVPVPIFVSARTFGPGAYIEFLGEGLDTLYTDTNVYRLEVNSALAARVGISRASLPRNPVYAPYYMETELIENNARYNYRSPNGDPWYDTLIYVNKSTPFNFTVNVDNLVSNAAPASVLVNMWGISDLITGPDHHALVAVNGAQVADEWFDFNDISRITAPIANGTMVNGVNTITLTAPADNGATYDMFALESYGIAYPRAFVATNNRLSFTAAGQAFRITGLTQDVVVAYRLENGLPVRLGNIAVKTHGAGYAASFAGGNEAEYWVSTAAALLTPEIRNGAMAADITGGTADLLIIAHPNFLSGFGPLVAARQAQGYTVKLVNVEDVYARYSGGIFDALAIRDYIHHAINYMGIKYIILGGGDTQDYRDYLKKGSISFIPSVYAQTTKTVMMAPVDPLYTDIDGDGVPDATVGRFPVRTLAELQMMVDKTLAYGGNPNINTLVLAADNGFEGDSELFATPLNFGPTSWNISRAYIGPMGPASARTILLAEMNNGPRLVSFVGHSGMTQWTTSTTSPLFKSSDAAALTNTDPMVVTQWGCWNTYYIDPTYNSLGHRFLLSGNAGAAAITGSTTITNSDAEQALGKILMPLMTEKGMPIGMAMQTAKSQLALSHPEMVDVLLGWTILGDPTLMIQP
jgi:uncharacterized repeat protein (TIGR01451 family)